ncbi:MAG TPA: ATP-dependent DNA helicase [Candidatus Nanoarchaeia archaeon]|nr:ATP-dependent DNA helicase [Candidatus Nanoarchaeia archaeon]
MPSPTLPEFFPHELIRAGQDKLVQDLDQTFQDKKILLAHAPTGLGKTASALSVALYHALKDKKKVLFLTNRHTQHQVAIETLKLIQQKMGQEIKCADLIGKRWMCSQEIANLFGNDFNEFCKSVVERGECEFYNNVREKKALTIEAKVLLSEITSPLHNEQIMARSKEKRMCGYEISLALAKKATVIIGDYYYLFNPHVSSTLFTKLELNMEDIIVIIDEGHNLPSRIAEMMSSNLTTFMIRNAIIEAKKFNYGGLIGWLQELNTIITKLAEFKDIKENEKLVAKEKFMSLLAQTVNYDQFVDELELAADEIRKKQQKSYLAGIAGFLNAWKGEDQGYTRIISEKTGKAGPYLSLSYICLDAAMVTRGILNQIHAGVIMSGTLKPAFMYKDVLGIEKGVEREYSSPFPAENKLSIIVPETSTKYALRGDAMYVKIAQKCSEMASLIPGNVAFFFPSYQLRDVISNYIQTPKKLFWEKPDWSKEEKEVFLAEFKATSKTGGILLGVSGGSFAEGIDYPGDLLNGVIVVGLPLARPNLHTQEIIKYYDAKFGKGWDYGYIYPAINKCLQSSGRCIRSETDKGAVIYLDERFAWQNYFICFPRGGLIVSKEYGKMLKEFFGNED